MANQGHEAKVSGNLLLLTLIVVVAIAVVVIIAIFFRPGGLNVEAQGPGVTIKLAFADSRVDLSEFLGQLFKKAESGTDADRRLVSSILQAHGFYRIPSAEAADMVKEGAASFHRQLIVGGLASEYENEIRVWLEDLE